MDPGTDADAQRLLAERRLLNVLRRFHAREPMTPDLRTDALIAMVRAGTDRPRSHRGATPLALSDTALHEVLDDLVARGEIERIGHRLRAAGHVAALSADAREMADALLAELRAAGADAPRVDGLARRLGVAGWIVDALRHSGELVWLAPGIEYPGDTLAALLDRLGQVDVDTVAEVRDELSTSRRYASALLDALRQRR